MSAVLQIVPLTTPWPTIDPFLFCVHHVDAYPRGNGQFGPAASLDGRELGQDFAGIDGWRMYHGRDVPGFPQHPHRGFETITYVRRGLVDHADSTGAVARYGRGDVQWLTAGNGIVHSETFPLLDDEQPNPLELFQIWVNLAAADKTADPHFAMLWDADIPRVQVPGVEVTVVAGALAGADGAAVAPPSPPPRSWAARESSDVAVWHARFDADSTWTIPAAAAGTVRVLYIFEGNELNIDGEAVAAGHAAVVECDRPVELRAASPTEVLVLQGQPIGEPVAQYGPFVMNTQAEIEQAFADYRRTQFGGWPWPSDEPVHGPGQDRFARRP